MPTQFERMAKATGSRHFVGYNHPVFVKTTGVKGKAYTESIYYYWWLALRRSERYEMACLKAGEGMQKIYKDFGDVFAYEETSAGFKSWWYEPVQFQSNDKTITGENNRGAVLFSEPPFSYDVEIVKKEELQDLSENWDAKEFGVVTIPTDLPKREILRRLEKQLDNMPNRKADNAKRYKRTARALYPVADWYKYDERSNGHLASVQSAFQIYDDWQQIQQSGEKKQRWLVAWESEGTTPADWDLLDGKFNIHDQSTYHSDVRMSYNVKFSRRMKYAELLIAGAEQGVFPSGQRKK